MNSCRGAVARGSDVEGSSCAGCRAWLCQRALGCIRNSFFAKPEFRPGSVGTCKLTPSGSFVHSLHKPSASGQSVPLRFCALPPQVHRRAGDSLPITFPTFSAKERWGGEERRAALLALWSGISQRALVLRHHGDNQSR